MFTGLVECIGIIKECRYLNKELKLNIITDNPWIPSLVIGESIAVNGACLTVTSLDSNIGFLAFASKETVQLTNFKTFASGSKVNLERALKIGERLGGHMVSGHVDGLGEILNIDKSSSSLNFKISFPKTLSSLLVPKGSITVDGVSLTINNIVDLSFDFNLIPHSTQITTLGLKKTGDIVNLETDLVGKYIHSWFKNALENKSLPEQIKKSIKEAAQEKENITSGFLEKHGFI